MRNQQEIFIENMKYYRKINSISQLQLAELCDVSSGTIGNIECGLTKPSFDLIISIAKNLNTSCDKLFIDRQNVEASFSNSQLHEIKNVFYKNLVEEINNCILDSIDKSISDLKNIF